MIIGEETLEVTWECIKILEDRIIEEDIEEIIGMKIITEKELGVGLGKDCIWTIVIEGKIGVVVIVDQDQDQEQVQIETELGVISVENMITSQKIALPTKEKERANIARVQFRSGTHVTKISGCKWYIW